MADERSYELFPTPGGVPVKAWIRGVPFEDAARQQLTNVARLPFLHRWVAVMPDVHFGIGATVGSVIATDGAIVPAAVGVDIGCGMIAQKTLLRAEELPDSLSKLRSDVERAIPHGGPGAKGSWTERGRHGLPAAVASLWKTRFGERWNRLSAEFPKVKGATAEQLGTLGTGNHFIEICLDGEGFVWVMLHSGSRGLGNRIARFFIEKAKDDMRRAQVNLPDKDLAYLREGSEFYDAYLDAVGFAQEFAFASRELMLQRTLEALRQNAPKFQLSPDVAINCHHNYVAREHHFGKDVWVTRKGAVRARRGDLGIIPGSMGARSFIVRGRGNAESFESCSHGAGRAMSRGEARRRFSVADHVAATAGVECRKDADVIDETPGAYKPIGAVMNAQADLVEVVHELRQVVCVKG
jgi:tRNA-splicing ligase RtcB (3'-phosphate/5'-hydroxy nucleic acid ligase)